MTVGYDEDVATTLRLFNSMFSGTDGTAISVGPAATITREDHDLFDTGPGNGTFEYRGRTYDEDDVSDGTWTRRTGLGTGTSVATPVFVGDEDFHLQAGSPGIDLGTSDGATQTALDGTVRPQGGGVDIGPYEG